MTLLVSHAVAGDCVVATSLDDITLKGKDGQYERFTDVRILRNKSGFAWWNNSRWRLPSARVARACGKLARTDTLPLSLD